MTEPKWGAVELAQADAATGGSDAGAAAAANRAPQAADVCVVTAEGAPLEVAVLEHASDPDGDALAAARRPRSRPAARSASRPTAR